MATKTQLVSASRAGVASVVVTDSQSDKTFMLAGVGAEVDPAPPATTVAPSAGSIAFAGYAPSLALSVSPGTGSLAFTGFALTLTSDSVVAPSAGSLSLTGFAPGSGFTLAPGAGSLVLTGFAPTPLALTGAGVFFRSVF